MIVKLCKTARLHRLTSSVVLWRMVCFRLSLRWWLCWGAEIVRQAETKRGRMVVWRLVHRFAGWNAFTAGEKANTPLSGLRIGRLATPWGSWWGHKLVIRIRCWFFEPDAFSCLLSLLLLGALLAFLQRWRNCISCKSTYWCSAILASRCGEHWIGRVSLLRWCLNWWAILHWIFTSIRASITPAKDWQSKLSCHSTILGWCLNWRFLWGEKSKATSVAVGLDFVAESARTCLGIAVARQRMLIICIF